MKKITDINNIKNIFLHQTSDGIFPKVVELSELISKIENTKKGVYFEFSDGEWDVKYSRFVGGKYNPKSKYLIFYDNGSGNFLIEIELENLSISDSLISELHDSEVETFIEYLNSEK